MGADESVNRAVKHARAINADIRRASTMSEEVCIYSKCSYSHVLDTYHDCVIGTLHPRQGPASALPPPQGNRTTQATPRRLVRRGWYRYSCGCGFDDADGNGRCLCWFWYRTYPALTLVV